MNEEEIIEAQYCGINLKANQLDYDIWSGQQPVSISHYWSGEQAPPTRHARAAILWTNEALLVRFDCHQAEPLIISSHPQTEEKTLGLWDRDVSEIFIVPDPERLNEYFEFEAARTGEWIDEPS